MSKLPQFYEFFAGGGMARAGLGPQWQCLFANDFDHRKVDTYRENWGANEVVHGDIRKLCTTDLPGRADLIWASFPCQDLSLAGGGAGLKGNRSGTFWPFWSLVKGLRTENRSPALVVLENVCGALTSHAGKDFSALCGALADEGYAIGALVADAALFLPQSRPRLFVVGVRDDVSIDPALVTSEPSPIWHPRNLVNAQARLTGTTMAKWKWWNLPKPTSRVKTLSEIVEKSPNDVRWHDPSETEKLLAMMAPLHRQKLEAVQRSGASAVGTVYRRTRRSETGEKVQRAEVRFDQTAGCLRTPAGGSSRQILLFVEGQRVRTRLVSSRETARLMGLPDSYILPSRYNEAYHLTGDGVVVDVVRHLSEHLLLPLVGEKAAEKRIA
ncbi:DNA cytosine methyltransferase [Phenylobacterium sp.]|uniref:DNA cytosine methyltransferase n=1 Tax=Phenylobacterium sp. TaxID=1871053 RepID=UPI0039195B98